MPLADENKKPVKPTDKTYVSRSGADKKSDTGSEKKAASQTMDKAVNATPVTSTGEVEAAKDIPPKPDEKTEDLTEAAKSLDLEKVKDADEESGEVSSSKIEPIVSAAVVERDKKGKAVATPPWTLQQFFDGEIDLDVELAKRFPRMPVLSVIDFRNLGTQTGRGVATLSSQDGAASLIVDVDGKSRVVHMSFTFGSMLTLRFSLDELNDTDRGRWLELMRREQGGLAFLWGPSRWEKDYMICISRKYFTNVYAFSPRNFEAAIRLVPTVAKKLLDWLDEFWTDEEPDESPPNLLTW